MHHRGQLLRGAAGSFLAAGVVFGCTAQPATDGEPAPAYRVALLPFVLPEDWPPGNGEAIGLSTATGAALHAELVDGLRAVQAASEIVPVRSATDAVHADIIVEPILRAGSFEASDSSDGAILSSVLWFLTWAGSFAIEDRHFDASFRIEYRLIDPSDPSRARSIEAAVEPIGLAYWDRHDLFPWGLLQSLFVFPFLSIDESAPTCRSLTRCAVLDVARDFKRYLSSEHLAWSEEETAAIRFLEPKNAATIENDVRLRFVVTSQKRIVEVRLWTDDGDTAYCIWSRPGSAPSITRYRPDGAAMLPPESEMKQAGDTLFRFAGSVDRLAFAAPGRHVLRLEALCGTGGAVSSSSTLVLEAAGAVR